MYWGLSLHITESKRQSNLNTSFEGFQICTCNLTYLYLSFFVVVSFSGDILVFLTGQDEIESLAKLVTDCAQHCTPGEEVFESRKVMEHQFLS